MQVVTPSTGDEPTGTAGISMRLMSALTVGSKVLASISHGIGQLASYAIGAVYCTKTLANTPLRDRAGI